MSDDTTDISRIYAVNDVVEATFRPTRTDDLLHGTSSMIGNRFHWQAQYPIESGDYEGQLAWMLWPPDTSDDADYHRPCVPTCDLADVEYKFREEWSWS